MSPAARKEQQEVSPLLRRTHPRGFLFSPGAHALTFQGPHVLAPGCFHDPVTKPTSSTEATVSSGHSANASSIFWMPQGFHGSGSHFLQWCCQGASREVPYALASASSQGLPPWLEQPSHTLPPVLPLFPQSPCVVDGDPLHVSSMALGLLSVLLLLG